MRCCCFCSWRVYSYFRSRRRCVCSFCAGCETKIWTNLCSVQETLWFKHGDYFLSICKYTLFLNKSRVRLDKQVYLCINWRSFRFCLNKLPSYTLLRERKQSIYALRACLDTRLGWKCSWEFLYWKKLYISSKEALKKHLWLVSFFRNSLIRYNKLSWRTHRNKLKIFISSPKQLHTCLCVIREAMR